MAHKVDYELIGDDMQAVVISLDQGETILADSGSMMFMTQEIQMESKMATSSDGGGLGKALLGGLQRVIAGESLFLSAFTCSYGSKGKVAFSAPYPGKIIPIDLSKSSILCQRNAYLCSAYGIEIKVKFTKRLGAGFFGGEGFVLQELSGDGLAFIHAGGTIIKKTLAAGEKIKLDTGCLVAFQPSVDYNIEFVGGIKTAIFGGEGLFLASLTGPGEVYMQTLPFSRMADRIVGASHGSIGESKKGGAGILGDLISGS